MIGMKVRAVQVVSRFGTVSTDTFDNHKVMSFARRCGIVVYCEKMEVYEIRAVSRYDDIALASVDGDVSALIGKTVKAVDIKHHDGRQIVKITCGRKHITLTFMASRPFAKNDIALKKFVRM